MADVYVSRDGQEIGNWPEAEFRDLVFRSEILPTDHYFIEGMPDWKPVSEYRAKPRTTLIAMAPNLKARGTPKKKRNRVLVLDMPATVGLLGASVLTLGVFAPIVRAPVFGTMNYVQNGRGDGMIVLAMGLFTFGLTATRRFKWLWITGGVATACSVFTMIYISRNMAALEQSIKSDDSIFSGLTSLMVHSVELQWGLPLLCAGGIVVMAAAALGTGLVQIKIAGTKTTAPAERLG